jgi:hypothetical protein
MPSSDLPSSYAPINYVCMYYVILIAFIYTACSITVQQYYMLRCNNYKLFYIYTIYRSVPDTLFFIQ